MMSDLIKKLRSDVIYRDALKAVKDLDDRKRIIYITESFLKDFELTISKAKSIVENNPAAQNELRTLLFNDVNESKNDR